MTYKAIGLMSGSSLDGLDIVFVVFNETGGQWSYSIEKAACYPYETEWQDRLKNAIDLSAKGYLLLHAEYGHYLAAEVNRFIEEHGLEFQVGIVGSHGHTTFHLPQLKMTGQLGDGAAIAAGTGLRVVSDLRALDVALGGQGAPIVPMGEKILWSGYDAFLNIGGIANISLFRNNGEEKERIAFDICAANRVLNMLAAEEGKEFDEGGVMASSGSVHAELLEVLDQLDYYKKSFPKSLANDFGTDTVYPLIKKFNLNTSDALSTYCEHIAICIKNAISAVNHATNGNDSFKMLVTGGGALNTFLIHRIQEHISPFEVVVPDESLVKYKEALIMALLAVLRWREEETTLSSVTGARQNSIGGAFWTGQEQ